MKTGKELKMNKFKNYNVVFGSVNNKNPKAIYINVSAWAEPIEEEGVNYNRVIKDMYKKLRQTLYNTLVSDEDSVFKQDSTLVDLDIRESGIRFGKRSFMSCEITLFVDSEIAANSEEMKNHLDRLTPKIIKTVFDENKIFNFYKKKI